jgi:hypothetical protein
MNVRCTYNVKVRVFIEQYYFSKKPNFLSYVFKILSKKGKYVIDILETTCYRFPNNTFNSKNFIHKNNKKLEEISFLQLLREVVFLLLTSLILYQNIR